MQKHPKSNLKLFIKVFFFLMAAGLLALSLKSNTSMKSNLHLNYILLKPRQKISLNIFESEKYEPAVIVQQLIGTLVYYSNFGRYEPRLAQSWQRTNETTWEFQLKDNLKCENGEVINAKSFKRSLERSLFIYEKKGGFPVLNLLVGFNEFVKNNANVKNISELSDLKGIQTDNNKLIFKFDQKVKSGFLQILSFSPFGYICEGNFLGDGSWADDLKFISSGPYKSKSITIGEKYILEKNEFWNDFEKNSPEQIIFTHSDTNIDPKLPIVIDAFTNEYTNPKLIEYKLVPEYLNSVLIGNTEKGFFNTKERRKIFKSTFDKIAASILPETFGVNTRSNTFYPNQKVLDPTEVKQKKLPQNVENLVIEGTVPIEGTSRWYAWLVLEKTLKELGLNYVFSNTEASFENMTNRKFDLRIRGSSVGGGVEPWGVFILFCSSVGINFPDPSGTICKLASDYESDLISEEDLTKKVLASVEDESALLPVSHYGVKLLLSDSIQTDTLSPALSIMKFDQISIN
jgi:hypothetical protein